MRSGATDCVQTLLSIDSVNTGVVGALRLRRVRQADRDGGHRRTLSKLNVGVKLAADYYPYGVEYTATANDTEKYATYTRDSSTGLDYAANRYYSSIWGRFLSADPYGGGSGGPGDPADPESWNRYAYAGNDPVNFYDPPGLEDDAVDCGTGLPCFSVTGTGSGGSGGWGGGGGPNGFLPVGMGQQTSGGGGGGGSGTSSSNSDPHCNRNDPTNAKVLDYISANQAAASELSAETGLSADFILAWGGLESGYGIGSAARLNNNFFG